MDKQLRDLITKEVKRQEETIDLIPSENIASIGVLEALGSPLTNKYSEGYPGKRYYGGHEVIDKIELLAQQRARKVFGLKKDDWHVNVQPYSGSPANMAIYYALLNPGDKILGLGLPFGGHLTHGWKVNFSARFYTPVQYSVDDDGVINYKEVEELAKKEKPQLIVSGATAYSKEVDYERFGKIARSVGAYYLADVSHEAGLIAGKVHKSPFKHADAVMMTTHKTLRGPRGAIIFANKNSEVATKKGIDIARKIDRAIFPALQGGPHDHQTAAIAACLEEALQPKFKSYARQIVKNSDALATSLEKLGFRIVSGGTDNHLMLIDLTSWGLTGKEAEELLGKVGVVVNRNAIPHDPRPPLNPSGIRLGTPSVTARGMKAKEMKQIALLIHRTINKEGPLNKLRAETLALCRTYPLFYLFTS